MPNSIIDQLKWRYACKAFDSDRSLNETQIQLLKEAFNLTASSYGLQPLKLLVISNKELKKNLVSASMNQKQIEQCSHLLVLCSRTDIDANYIHSYFKLVMEQCGTEEKILVIQFAHGKAPLRALWKQKTVTMRTFVNHKLLLQ